MPKSREGSHRTRHRTVAQRSGREWAVRGALAAGALVLGYMSITNTLANVVVKLDPRAAHALAPGDGRNAAAAADQAFAKTLDSTPDSKPARLARHALRRDPTAVEALNVLGLQAQLREEEALADRVFGYSFALSRRELRPQIWAIEEAVGRGDIRGALDNYDIALRTSKAAQTMLFPILASAISEQKIRAPLIDILATEPRWARPFIAYAAINSPKPRAVVQLFGEAEPGQLPIESADRAHVVTRLVAQNLTDEAWVYYRTFRSNAERGRSRDPGFALDARVRTPFDWNLGNAPSLSVAILKEEGGGVLDFSVPPSTRVTVASQTQLLPPGDYRLQGRSGGIEQPQRSRPYWLLTCQAGRELGRVEVPDSEQAGGRFSGLFTVPSACPVQNLSLIVRASDEISGVSGQIKRVELAPVTQ